MQQSLFTDMSRGRQVCWLPLDQIEPRNDIAYSNAQGQSLSELTASIRRFGLLEPITVSQIEYGRYEIIAGNRRYYACRMAGFSHIDALIMPGTLQVASINQLFQALLTKELHFFEEAKTMEQILAECPITQDDLARRLNKSTSYIATKLRLLKLEPTVQCLILDYSLSESHAKALLRLPDLKNRLRIAQKAYDEKLSARDTEMLVDSVLHRLPVPPPPVGRVVALMRDHRIYLNAIKGIVDQMTETGLGAQMEVTQGDEEVMIQIKLPKRR